jgi:hypothetical protein
MVEKMKQIVDKDGNSISGTTFEDCTQAVAFS